MWWLEEGRDEGEKRKTVRGKEGCESLPFCQGHLAKLVDICNTFILLF